MEDPINNQTFLSPDDLSGLSSDDMKQATEFINRANAAQAAVQQELEAQQAREAEQAKAAEPQPNFATETGAALAGGAAQAVESVGSFAELTGDTLKTGFNKLFGIPLDETQNPFSSQYQAGDASWLDIPDEWVPENKTGLGKLARGLVEFGLLTAATGGTGGLVGGAARVGTRVALAGRAAGLTSRQIKFVTKGAKILGDGAAAELISNSAEDENLMNLVNEYTPWMSSWVSNALAVDEEDNPWSARIKTVAVGAGLNGVAHGVTGYVAGRLTALRELRKGKSVDEANAAGNAVKDEVIAKGLASDEAASKDMAEMRYADGQGVSTKDPRDEYLKKYLSADEYKAYQKQQGEDPENLLTQVDEQIAAAEASGDKTLLRRLKKTRKEVEKDIEQRVDYDAIADQRGEGAGDPFDYATNQSATQAAEAVGRQPDPFVNGEKFDATEKATYGKDSDATVRNLQESIVDSKVGGSGKSATIAESEANLLRMSRGDKNLYQYIKEVSEDIARESFKSLDNRLDYREVQNLILRQTLELTSMIEDGGDIAKKFADYFVKNDKNARIYLDNGTEIVTATPAQRAALQLTIHTLAKRAQDIATGAVHMADDVNIYRQADMVFDAMKVALIEHKKVGYMWGLDGKRLQDGLLPAALKADTEKQLAKVTDDINQYIEELKKLTKNGQLDDVRMLLEAHSLTNNVRTLEHLHDFIRAKVWGGSVNGIQIRGELRKQIQSTFYNSILSAPITPIKAIVGTNFISFLRPIQAWMGATLKGDQKQAVIAAAQLDAIGQSLGESWQMFKHNWDQGFQAKAQSYDMKYDVGEDIREWKRLKPYIEKYGSQKDKLAYSVLDASVKFNTLPGVKYSQNLMGAGDAFARTVIGRMEMRRKAALKVIEKGADLSDVTRLSREIDEQFRSEIFSKNAEGRWIVTDTAARLAGDEAAMTKALEGVGASLEGLSDHPVLRAFFPFVRTGFNALDIAFEHTPLRRFQQKFKDITKGENLEKYGIFNDDDLAAAKALMDGRLATGYLVSSMAVIAALSGNMTGNEPLDKETRDNWKAAGIPPLSFKVPGTNTYISYRNIEPFNTLFAMVANVAQNFDVLGEDWTERWLQKVTFMFSSVIVDKSMLSGVEDLARLFNPETSGDLLARTGSRYLRSHLPYAGLLGSIGDVVDANQKEAQKLTEMIARRDALFKSFLPPRYDILSKDRTGKQLVYGPEDVMLRAFNAFSPIPITYTDGDSVKQTLLETRFNLPQTLSTYREEPLNSYEMSQMQLYLSKGDLRKNLEALFNEPAWRKEFEAYKNGKNLNSANDVKLTKQGWYLDIKDVFDRAKKDAISEFLYYNPEFKERFENREAINVLSKSGSIEELEALVNMPK